MAGANEAIEAAVSDAERLRRTLKRKNTLQVRSIDEKALIKATALAWFNNYRQAISSTVDGELLYEVDSLYKDLLSGSARSCMRSTYDTSLKALCKELSDIRVYSLTAVSSPKTSTDAPPDFGAMVADPEMKSILERRWKECSQCIKAGAPLAATVMMGGLLEALLLARVNKERDKSLIFKAKRAPRDKNTGKTLPLKEWTLRHYIDIAHELNWISQSAKDVGDVVRDYRNYVHPQKELSHGITLQDRDASLFWEICKSISRQLL